MYPWNQKHPIFKSIIKFQKISFFSPYGLKTKRIASYGLKNYLFRCKLLLCLFYYYFVLKFFISFHNSNVL